MAFDISSYPQKSGILFGIPGELDSAVFFQGINLAGWQDFTVKLFTLQDSDGIFTGNMFDYSQDRDYVYPADPTDPLALRLIPEIPPGTPIMGFEGNGINRFYPSPTGYKYGNDSLAFTGNLHGTSGIIITYPPLVPSTSVAENHPEYESYDGSKGTGIFNFAGFLNNFSNAKRSKEAAEALGTDSFQIFSDYVHYYPGNFEGSGGIRIPFVADLTPSSGAWDRYGPTIGNLLLEGIAYKNVDTYETIQDLTDPDY